MRQETSALPGFNWRGLARYVVFPMLIFGITFITFAVMTDSGSAALFAQDAPAAADAAPKAAAPKTALGWLLNALGPLYIVVFLSLSFILVALFIMNILSARREAVCPQHLIEGFEAHLDEKQYQEAYELAKADESFLGNVSVRIGILCPHILITVFS